jgi:hypothetical protein
MFGGYKSIATVLNDLWKFDITTNEWTWMSGSSIPNQPGNYGVKGVADLLMFPRHAMSTAHGKTTMKTFGSLAD